MMVKASSADMQEQMRQHLGCHPSAVILYDNPIKAGCIGLDHHSRGVSIISI